MTLILQFCHKMQRHALLFGLCLMQHVWTSSSHRETRPVLELRGGGWLSGRGVKRSREDDWRPLDSSLQDAGGDGIDAGAEMMRPTKVARSAWAWGWHAQKTSSSEDVGHVGQVFQKLVSSASSAWQGALRILSWSSNTNTKLQVSASKKKGSYNTKLVFSGDVDKPAAIKRQVEFYFSDSNLPTGTYASWNHH
jgi:hypothetical protein